MRITVLAWLLLLLLVAANAGAQPAGLPVFVDVTQSAGIDFKHSFGDHELSNIVEGTGPGASFFDYDGDGHLDLYLPNGCWLSDVNDNRGRDLRGKLSNALYRNNGDGSFSDVTEAAGVGHQGYGMGASTADYDNDGDLDLYVLNYDANVLYRNDGDGSFTDVSEESGLADPFWTVSAPWFDYDGDGDMDVYVANYLEYDIGAFRDFFAAEGYPGPLSYNARADRLYRNEGDGSFTDVTEETGLHYPDGRAMSGIITDLNNDGLLDIYVTNDASSNCFFMNKGDGSFSNEALRWGLAFGEGGQGASSMGPIVGDVNRDGLMDVFVPDMAYGALLLNKGRTFIDVTAMSNLAVTCGQYTGWGGGLIDYDNDGFLDVYVANGDPHHEYNEEDVLMWNDGNGKFIDVADESGAYFREKYVGRGAAFADYDNDGDVDILVMNLNGPAKLLRNDGGNKNNWLTVNPVMGETRLPVIGTRVTVSIGDKKIIREISPVTGYLSQSDPRAHFGLGDAAMVDLVELRWPNGESLQLTDVAANQSLDVSFELR